MTSRRAVLLDIDGVLIVSWEALPGAVGALAAIKEAGLAVRLLTNTTSRTRARITAGLRGLGFDVTEEEVLTVAQVARQRLLEEHPGARCLLLNTGDLAEDLPGVTLVGPDAPPEEVDVVLLGGAGEQFTHAALTHVHRCVRAGATLMALHRNLAWQTADGLTLDTGYYLLGLERVCRKRAHIIGKPERAMFEAAVGSLGVTAGEALMVGDDLDSDVRGAQRAGMAAVQVRTGKFRDEQLDIGGRMPDAVIDSVADLPRWLGLTGD